MTNLGLGADGKRRRRFFKDREQAEQFINDDARFDSDPYRGRRHEVLFCLERLDRVGVPLHEAVEFYVRHGAKKTNPPLSEAIAEFLKQKRLVGRGYLYLQRMEVVLRQLRKFAGENIKVGDISTEMVRNFVYVEHAQVGNVSKVNLLTHLSVFFNYCLRNDVTGFNPVSKIERPIIKFKPPHTISPEHFADLLHRCVKMKWHNRMTIFVLVGFCGIRIEEASKLDWSHIDFIRKTVLVPADVAKKAGFRMNKIPPNAMEWIQLTKVERRNGKIIGANWRTLVRSSIRFAKIDYGQNCIRHSFCSYAISSGWSLVDVISYMGHSGSPSMIYSHYRNVVSEEDGKKWFSIVP